MFFIHFVNYFVHVCICFARFDRLFHEICDVQIYFHVCV